MPIAMDITVEMQRLDPVDQWAKMAQPLFAGSRRAGRAPSRQRWLPPVPYERKVEEGGAATSSPISGSPSRLAGSVFTPVAIVGSGSGAKPDEWSARRGGRFLQRDVDLRLGNRALPRKHAGDLVGRAAIALKSSPPIVANWAGTPCPRRRFLEHRHHAIDQRRVVVERRRRAVGPNCVTKRLAAHRDCPTCAWAFPRYARSGQGRSRVASAKERTVSCICTRPGMMLFFHAAVDRADGDDAGVERIEARARYERISKGSDDAGGDDDGIPSRPADRRRAIAATLHEDVDAVDVGRLHSRGRGPPCRRQAWRCRAGQC